MDGVHDEPCGGDTGGAPEAAHEEAGEEQDRPATIEVHIAKRVSRVALKRCPKRLVTERAPAYSARKASGPAAPLHLAPRTTATRS